MTNYGDPMAAVRAYVDAFNAGDAKAMAAVCADPMQILDGMSPHVWQGPTAAEDWYADALAEGEHLGVSDYRIRLGNRGMSMSPASSPTSWFPPPSITKSRTVRSISRVLRSPRRFAVLTGCGD
ncbi:Uncharacterised protein [Mycolicibacterium fortuitum]|uniref:SnoaL-like domain-containing protein n=1 Tax=Mycolicibacterium fortuitum TaxID=1766 RepID=A0A378V540_MYCFO|nr:Uncharacterised protein [Mycolicibacterium fortuitum]